MRTEKNKYMNGCMKFFPLWPDDVPEETESYSNFWYHTYIVAYPIGYFKFPAISISSTYTGTIEEMEKIKAAIDLAIEYAKNPENYKLYVETPEDFYGTNDD